MPARTLSEVEIHNFIVSSYAVAFAITHDGHTATAHGGSPQEAHGKLKEWLATLPALPEPPAPVVEMPAIVAVPAAVEPDAS